MNRPIVLLFGALLTGMSPTGPAGSGAWPEKAWLATELPAPTTGHKPIRLYLDAGHGSGDNTGNLSAFCELEEDFTLALARDVRDVLGEMSDFEVRLSRDGDSRPSYEARVEEAQAWQADLFVSLHSDVRGRAEPWEPEPQMSCPRTRQAPGFSVLVSDAADDVLVASRQAFALTLGATLKDAGFLPYDGAHYRSDYDLLEDQPGVFVERAEQPRIFVLHAPTMPSLIVETHNALDDREAMRFREPGTRRALAAALAKAALFVTR